MGISRLESWTKRVLGDDAGTPDKKALMVRAFGLRFWVPGDVLCLKNVPHTSICRAQGKAEVLLSPDRDRKHQQSVQGPSW